jgi:hypothetical protein
MGPPWGGLDYRPESERNLNSSGIDMGILVEKLKHRAKYIALKLP